MQAEKVGPGRPLKLDEGWDLQASREGDKHLATSDSSSIVSGRIIHLAQFLKVCCTGRSQAADVIY